MGSVMNEINLDNLHLYAPVISSEAVGFYKENCMVCFHYGGHQSGLSLAVAQDGSNHELFVLWSGNVTEQMLRSYGDMQKTTEHAACAIALSLVYHLTEFTAIEQSAKGTTIDYFLGLKEDDDDTLIFNHKARLEVSGILKEDKSNTVEKRIREKLKRLAPDDLPALIVVVEFSKPRSKMVRHE